MADVITVNRETRFVHIRIVEYAEWDEEGGADVVLQEHEIGLVLPVQEEESK
jgi:hypothetical protein